MTGELLREAGVLIVVFYPVREGLSGGGDLRQGLRSIVGGLFLYGLGMLVERMR